MVIDQEIIDDIQIAYYICLLNIFQVWVYSRDEEIDLKAAREKQLMEVNSMLMTFVPNEGYATISIFPSKESKITFPNNFFNTMRPYFEEVENKLLETYNYFIRKFKCWIELRPRDRIVNFGLITGIFKNIYQYKDQFKLRFKIKSFDGPIGIWIPIQFENYFRLKPAYKKYIINTIDRERKLLQDNSKNYDSYYLSEKKFAIQCYEEELIEINIPRYYDKDYVSKIEDWIVENKPNTRSQFYFNWPTLSLFEAFPDRI